MLGALIGGGIGGLIGGYLGASAGSSHSSGGSCGRGGGYSIDNYDAMQKELEAIRKNRKKIEEFKQLSDKQQKQIIENTEGLKELLELNIRLSLMTEDEKLVFRQLLIAEEMEAEQEELEKRVEDILQTKHSQPDFHNRFENRDYILDLIDICYCWFAEHWDFECGDDEKKFIVGYIGNAPIYSTSADERISLCEKVAKKYHYDFSTIYSDARNVYYGLYKF